MIITLQTLVFFRESLLNALDRLLRPYYNKFSLAFGRNNEISEDEDADEQVFAEYDDERGVVFYPPMYLQRYAAVSDCLLDERWCGKIEKIVDLGYHDMSFINYLKEVQGIKCILGVDIESIPLQCSLDVNGCDDYIPKRESPLEVTLFKGNAADPDYRLIGCDAVIAIEMIEHMLPHDLDRLIHTVFGFIKPQIAIFTTPNKDFNILFKALEKNGLRRLDHFFEWSREQFHDWCSNIVVRYPQYTVSCKGIGPGPNGTSHLGCCTQLALFVAKEYHKQQDLNLNSLALVSETPSPNSISNLISSWESIPTPNESKMIEAPKTNESYSELSYDKQSSITIVLTTPSSSYETLPCQDKTSQCDLDTENERNYLMFDYEQMCFDVVKPRKMESKNKVYDMEDVYNRLNCTTLEVKKFSKTTQNLMSKNRVDSLVHTREVVDEIRHLTKMLNFNKETNKQVENGTYIWCNINWGENAPYWNQYYKVVQEYHYPFESKSEECRILDLISDEINRLIDTEFDEDFSFDVNKLEIPIERLMKVVEHITDDVEKVKDLLEWNGYEILGDMVVHSRLVVDYTSVEMQEDDSPDTDMCSDWDSTDMRSTSVSDGSTIVADYHARCLWRALDKKVRKLRSMLTADEDITSELDKVVCRLMKLALRTSQGRNTPPPTRWMQYKLLDLLTLTEKAIERRKRHFISNYPIRAINYEEKADEMIALEKIKEDDTASKICNKYGHLIREKGGTEDSCDNDPYLDFDLDDDLTLSSAEFAKDYEIVDNYPIDCIGAEKALPNTKIFDHKDDPPKEESKLERTQAWVEEDIEVVPYPEHDGNFDNSSIETDHNVTTFSKYYKKRYKGKPCIELNCVICKQSHSKAFERIRKEQKSKENSKTKLVNKMSRKKSSNNNLRAHSNNKYVSVDYKTYRVKPRRKYYKTLYPTASKPIPLSLIELCRKETMPGSHVESRESPVPDAITNVAKDTVLHGMQLEVADTKESLFMEIVTDDTQEILALRRSVGTDADDDSMNYEDETLIQSYSNTLIKDEELLEKHNVATENDNSQTIFLYDINEPTTSKGIRHVGMDVQCGPDFTVPVLPMLSATTSLTRMPKIFTAGIRIGNSTTDTKIQSTEFGTCTYDNNNYYKTIMPRKRSLGITIRDSDSNIFKQTECPIVPVNSKLSAATSLTRLPPMMVIENLMVNSSTNNDKINSNNCGTSTQGVENIKKCDLPIGDKKNNNKIINNCGTCTDNVENTNEVILPLVNPDNGSKSNILKVIECSTDTQDLLDNLNDILPTHLKPVDANKLTSKILDNADTKEKDKNIIVNVQFPTNLQECYDKFNVSSSKKKTSPKSIQKIRECISNLPKRVKGSKSKQTLQGKMNVLSQQPSKKVTKLPKAISKQRLVDTTLKDIVSNTAGSKECIQKASTKHNAATNQVSKKVSRLPKVNKKSVDSKSSNSPRQMKRSANTCNSCDTSEETLETSSAETSNAEQLHTDIAIYEKQQLPKSIDDTLNGSVTLPCSENATLKTSVNETKNKEATSDFCENVDSAVIQTQNTLQNSDIQVICGVNRLVGHPGRPSFKCGKPKLCHGGIQVYSYKDKQSLSEDVMYQGEWQVNRPKLITKRKCFNPLASRKTESQLKKTVLSKEKIKIKAIVYHRNAIKRDVRSQKNLKPHTFVIENSKQEPNTTEIKQYLKLQSTANVGPEVKPFRNFVKVPSTFPTSTFPSKKLKSPFIVKKSPITSDNTVIKDDKTIRKKTKKNYLPLYLRKRILSSVNDIRKEDLNLSFDSAKSKIKKSNEKSPSRLLRSKTEEIKRDLLKFHTKPPKHQYDVFCNEIEKKKSDGQQMKNSSDSANVKNRDASRRRSTSPTSQNSSTCSSPCSIATVRAISTRSKNSSDSRRPTSSYTTSTGNSGSESTTPDRSRKGTKRSKSIRSTTENKENIPQTSKQFNITKNDSPKLVKNMFKGQKKDVYIAHVKEKSSLQLTAKTLSKHKIQKSNVNIISRVVSINDKSSTPRSQSPSKKASVKFEDSMLSTARNVELSESSQTSNMVLVIEPQTREIDTPTDTLKSDKNNVFNLRSVTNWLNNSCENIDHEVQSKDITSAMRELVDETLYFIEDESYNSGRPIDSETVILSRENLNRLADLIKSPSSVRTILTSHENCNEILVSDLEIALERSFDIKGDDSVVSLNDTRLTVTDFDALSFRSITSGSRLSGYLSADNEFSSSIKLPKCNMPSPKSMSVRDIFERKEQPFQPAQPQVVSGSLANQAFSGFTINGDPVSGDQPDPINYMDSETGSYSVNRQATSEELMISGRSSDTFESCELDEDIVVPNWLFQMINQQHSDTDESEPPAEFMVPLPPDEPMFDVNGNVVEGPVGAGAGDGRGMHSDQSQDSSGRGTSVSSSETSSGPQSEAILIDPSAFMAQFELLREAVASSVVMVTGENTLENAENVIAGREGPVETDVVSFSRGESRRIPRASAPPGTTASDIDADVSSLDTDAVDSSDN